MQSKPVTRSAVVKRLFLALAVCVPVLLVFSLAQGQHRGPPSQGAQGMPGAMGTIEYRPPDWRPGGITFWYDTDGVDPGVPGCHIGVVDGSGTPNGRTFGEACADGRVLIESNPGVRQIHGHNEDTGHTDTFDCHAWCVGMRRGQTGICRAVAGPPPCAQSAVCECR